MQQNKSRAPPALGSWHISVFENQHQAVPVNEYHIPLNCYPHEIVHLNRCHLKTVMHCCQLAPLLRGSKIHRAKNKHYHP